MAGMLSATIAATLLAGVSTAAWLLEGLFAFALLEVVGARFCRGAYVYQRLCSRVSPKRCPPPAGREPLRQA
jgi:hypothetical protein